MFWTEYPRDIVEVAGPDSSTYLQSQLSQDLRQLQVGESTWSFVLQPTGKVEVLLRVWRTADDQFVLDTDAGFGAAMIARLNRFKIRVKAEITSLDWRCIAVRDDGAATSDDQVATALPDGGVVAWGSGYDLLGPAPVPPAGAEAGDADRLLAARVAAVWPSMGAEIVPGEAIPAETGVVAAAVSFTKGCYPGQELVERMDSRGAAAPRLLQRVTVAAGTQAGDPYVVDGATVGTITTVWRDQALASIKRSALPH
jgi:folate-binding protein YgfZ